MILGRRVCGWIFLQKFSLQLFKINWRRQGGVAKIETKQAAGKLEGWKTLGRILAGFCWRFWWTGPFWESPKLNQPSVSFVKAQHLLIFFRCLSEFSGFFSSRWKNPSMGCFLSKPGFLVLKFTADMHLLNRQRHTRHLLGRFSFETEAWGWFLDHQLS